MNTVIFLINKKNPLLIKYEIQNVCKYKKDNITAFIRIFIHNLQRYFYYSFSLKIKTGNLLSNIDIKIKNKVGYVRCRI
jgi:hypothetical protein